MAEIIVTGKQFTKLKTNIQEQESDLKGTFLSLAGIFDPTGIVDMYNSYRYYKQGNMIFAFLSLVSAVPYVGDLIGKTVMGSMKVGGPGLKYLKAAEDAVKAGNTNLAIRNLKLLQKTTGPAGKFARTTGEWAGRVDKVLDRISSTTLGSGFGNTMKNWVNLFRSASSRTASVRRLIINKTPQEQAKLIKGLEGALRREKFLDPQVLSKPGIFQRILYGGGLGFGKFTDLFGKSTLRTRILMGQTKFYLGFLDYLGIGNFIGPEELSKSMGNQEMLSSMKTYESTTNGQQDLKDEFGNPQTNQTNTLPTNNYNMANNQISQSPISVVLNKLMSPV